MPILLGPVGWVAGVVALVVIGVAEALLHDGKKR
jgi:amino acid permease